MYRQDRMWRFHSPLVSMISMEGRKYLWKCTIKWRLITNAYCRNTLYHTQMYYINIPTSKVAPLSIQESCELSAASLLESMTSLDDLQNNGCERHKMCVEKTSGKELQNQVVMKMKCMYNDWLAEKSTSFQIQKIQYKKQYRKMHGIRTNTNNTKQGQTYV